jgi:uncharacterized protein (DUF885 family)
VSQVFDISDRYCTSLGALDPCGATYAGIPGHDHELTDFSPEGEARRVDLARATLRELRDARRTSDDDRLAADVMADRLRLIVEQYEANERWRDLRIIGSPVQTVRQCFDLMRSDTDDDWEVITERMTRVGDALAGIEATLREGTARRIVAARRQALACAEQAATWGGLRPTAPFFRTLAARRPGDSRLAEAAEAATLAYAHLAGYLRDKYAPRADPRDPVGRDRYALFARDFVGMNLDLEETYAWGWDELRRIEARMQRVAERILPGASIAAAIAHLDADPVRVIDGVDEFRRWNQDLIDRTIDVLGRSHFDIAEPLRVCEAMIAPPGGAAAMYYTAPTEDFSRPGRTWYPTMGATRFPLWKEVTTCYHEAVPGHHLQVAQVVYLSQKLSRFQRLFGFVSGHGEGWALYAERLMDELGYLDDPAFEMGMLAAQAMRAVRVVVDIGMHLELPIVDGEPHAGDTWTPELALPFVIAQPLPRDVHAQ